MSLTAGVDLGGTKIAAALVDGDYNVTARERVPTPTDGPAGVIEAITAAVTALGDRPDLVGVGAPGPVSSGVVRTAPNLPGWTQPVPLARELGSRMGVPVIVDNDATVGTVGEWRAGAGRGVDFLLGVWLGTGVGGGLVLGGRPYRGALGLAGELGHVCVHFGGALCGCGRRGCVEAYAGRRSMEHTLLAAVQGGRTSVLPQLARDKGKERLTSGVWAKALDAGDELATAVVDEAVAYLGASIAGVLNLLDLQRVVVGGGLTEKFGQQFADRVAAAARPYLLVPDAEHTMVVAELGDDAGTVGAAALARELLQR